MNKSKLSACGAMSVIILVLAASTARAEIDTDDVKSIGARAMADAKMLTEKGTCQSLNLAKKTILFYQDIRKDDPNELPDKGDALNEINNYIGRYCTRTTSTGSRIVYTPAPIQTAGGGVITCTACMPREDGVAADPLGGMTKPVCSACQKINALTLALIYIKEEDRAKFLEKLDPAIRTQIIDFINSNPAVVRQAQDTILKEATAPARVGPSSDLIHGTVIDPAQTAPSVLTGPSRATPSSVITASPNSTSAPAKVKP
jgi:hypothetical protein